MLMKIAILSPTFAKFSGPDRVVERQAQDLVEQGHHVSIFTLYSEIDSPNRVKVFQLGSPKNATLERLYRLFFFLDFPKINKWAKRLKNYDKIICHMYPMTLIAKKAKKKYGVHYNYYNMGVAYPQLFRNFLERTYMRFFLYLTKKTVRGASSATSISNFLKEELKKETGVDGNVELCKINPIYNKNVSPGNLKTKYDLSFPTFLYVGRISPHKGVHLLIKSFKLIQKQFPNAKLLIVGKHTFEEYSKELKKLAKKNKQIIFAGFVADEELPKYYAACDVYTTATLWEGFDLPAAEAQACGKPVVAFDIGAHKEIISRDNLVKANDIGGFAKAVIKIINDKKRTESL
jgi:glycosyltransferase involved in cell wall biosynthesis